MQSELGARVDLTLIGRIRDSALDHVRDNVPYLIQVRVRTRIRNNVESRVWVCIGVHINNEVCK